jgi:N-acetylneuraminic acid mutarotase
MLVWGGVVPSGQRGAYGAAYNPASDTWRPLADGPLSARSNHTAVWTGRRMLVWGGQRASHGDRFLADGAGYDPASDAWNPLPAAPLAARDRHVAVWTGTEMVILGGCCDGDAPIGSGAAFRPS